MAHWFGRRDERICACVSCLILEPTMDGFRGFKSIMGRHPPVALGVRNSLL